MGREGRDIGINVGLGTGQKDEKQKALPERPSPTNADIPKGYGPRNGLVSLTNIRNTLTDMLLLVLEAMNTLRPLPQRLKGS